MPNLGIFLFLAFLGPGIVIVCALFVLWPELRSLIASTDFEIEILVSLPFLAAFLSGHLPLALERKVFFPLWSKIFQSVKIPERSQILKRRTSIIVGAEIYDINHRYVDTLLGEYILYFNSSFWVFLFSIPRFIVWHDNITFVILIVSFFVSVVCLFFTCPIFQLAYIDGLELLESEIKIRKKRR